MILRQQLASIIRRIPLLMKIPYYIYRFIQPKYSIGVVGVVVNNADEFLLVEHVFHPRLPKGLPGGWIGFNEDPMKTVQREIQEELELDVRVEELLITGKTQYNHLDFAYLCTPQGEIGNLSYELLGYAWYKEHELPDLPPFHHHAIKAAIVVLKNKE